MTDETNVKADQLPQYARYWDQNASKLNYISRRGMDLEFPLPAGIFSNLAAVYNQVCREVSRLCGQGNAQMQLIADGLLSSYHRYADTEQENIQRISSVDNTGDHQAP